MKRERKPSFKIAQGGGVGSYSSGPRCSKATHCDRKQPVMHDPAPMSAYELERRETVKANEAFLASLNLMPLVTKPSPDTKAATRRRPPPKKGVTKPERKPSKRARQVESTARLAAAQAEAKAKVALRRRRTQDWWGASALAPRVHIISHHGLLVLGPSLIWTPPWQTEYAIAEERRAVGAAKRAEAARLAAMEARRRDQERAALEAIHEHQREEAVAEGDSHPQPSAHCRGTASSSTSNRGDGAAIVRGAAGWG